MIPCVGFPPGLEANTEIPSTGPPVSVLISPGVLCDTLADQPIDPSISERILKFCIPLNDSPDMSHGKRESSKRPWKPADLAAVKGGAGNPPPPPITIRPQTRITTGTTPSKHTISPLY